MKTRQGVGAQARALRLARLQALVDTHGPVPIKQAALGLDVTEMTVRRDLASPGSPLKALGGYVLATAPSAAERYSLDAASDQQAANKRLACQHAAQWVQPHDSLFIDCGTTMVHFAEALPADIPLSVVCYSSNILSILSQRRNTQLMLMGGLYHPSSATFFSEEGLQYLHGLGVNKAFISAGGLDLERGASCSNFHEVPVKQAAIRNASQSFLIVDESKLGALRPAFFSPLADFARIVVGGASTPTVRKQFKALPVDYARLAQA